MDRSQVAAYLDRIGASPPARPDAASLAELQRRHLFAVPFENLSIHLGEPIVLNEDGLFDKLVHQRRGGFGRFSTRPLRLDADGDQPDREGTLRITSAGSGDLDISLDGVPQYRIEPRPRTLADFEPTCWWHQTSSKSHFTQSTVCTLPTERGRITLSGRTLIETVSGTRAERLLASDAEVLAAYQTYFGIALEHVPPTIAADRGRLERP